MQYVAHLPVIVAFQVVLKDVPLSPLMKMPLVLVATIAALLVVYRYAVRPTVVGEVLNGRKYPAALTPAIVPAG